MTSKDEYPSMKIIIMQNTQKKFFLGSFVVCTLNYYLMALIFVFFMRMQWLFFIGEQHTSSHIFSMSNVGHIEGGALHDILFDCLHRSTVIIFYCLSINFVKEFQGCIEKEII